MYRLLKGCFRHQPGEEKIKDCWIIILGCSIEAFEVFEKEGWFLELPIGVEY
tara:strand:+ start:1083 stop:1238 length:156 start_codon:yes stop_codon:yes gene_type:complete